MTIQTFKKYVSILAVFLSMVSFDVTANCNNMTGEHLDANVLLALNLDIGNSENAGLKAAFEKGNCEITKLIHGGGLACPNGSNIKSHMTVSDKKNLKTCHVFMGVKRNGGICTTCQ